MGNVGKIWSKCGSGSDLLTINNIYHLCHHANCRVLKFFKSNSGKYKIAGSILRHRNMPWKKAIESSGNYFFILLYTYAGLTKLLERELFYLNLLNSPILMIEKEWVVIASWLIPFIELFVVFLLVYPKTTVKGLYSSIGLLSLYTLYILALLFFASYMPCSCEGIIDSFTWEQQLWFTLACLSIAMLTLYLKKHNPNQISKNRKKYAL